MGSPRRVVPGATYLITRRCYQRTFRLRPSEETTRIFKYCLAFAAEKTGVVLHAVCVMSNHHHLVVTDPNGVLPDFLQELHRSTAKALNALQGQWENLWAAEKCNAVVLAADEDVLDKMAYVAANPVAAGLVEQPEDWPGLAAWDEMSEEVGRPAGYFAETGTCPASLALRIVKPGVSAADSEWRWRLRRAIDAKVADAHHKVQAQGRKFLGRAGVLAQSFVKRAKSFEQKPVIVPNLAAKNPVVRRALKAVQRAFRVGYRKAREQWCGGVRDVVFPFGTWWMRVFHAAAAAAEPDPATG